MLSAGLTPGREEDLPMGTGRDVEGKRCIMVHGFFTFDIVCVIKPAILSASRQSSQFSRQTDNQQGSFKQENYICYQCYSCQNLFPCAADNLFVVGMMRITLLV